MNQIESATELTQDEQQLLRIVLDQANHRDREFFDSLSQHERDTVLRILSEFRTAGHSQLLETIWEIDYEEQPLPIEKWFEDEYFCGPYLKNHLYDKWKEVISQVVNNDDIVEVVLTGSIGCGKTTAAIALQMRKLYEVLCLRDPCAYFGNDKMRANAIVFGLFSISLHLARSVEYRMLTDRLLETEFFRSMTRLAEKGDRVRRPSEEILRFPKNVRFVFGSRGLHALGQDIFSGILDEVAFSVSKEAKQVVDLYNQVKRRLESRFMASDRGRARLPGVLCVVSSAAHDGDWLDQHIKKNLKKESTYIKRFAIYDVRPMDGPRFRVLVGDRTRTSRILDVVTPDRQVVYSDEPLPEDARIEWVPAALYESYVEDVEGALRDHSGIAIYSGSPLFTTREKIYQCVDDDRDHPFKVEEPRIHIGDDLTLEEVFIKERLFHLVDPFRRTWEIIRNKESGRFVHVDLAYKSNAAGLAVCHVAGTKDVARTTSDGRRYVTSDITIEVDLVLRIPPTPGSEIDIGKIRSFLYYLIELGMPIVSVTYDSYQSLDSIQSFLKSGIDSKRVSVDRTPEPYLTLKSLIMEERISFYRYPALLSELTSLQRVDYNSTSLTQRYKIDHPPGSSKDVADALAGAAWGCVRAENAFSSAVDPSVGILGLREMVTKPPSQLDSSTDSRWLVRDVKDSDLITDIVPFDGFSW